MTGLDGTPHPLDDLSGSGYLDAIDSDRVYGLVRAVFTNLDRLRAMHPALAELEPRQMAALGLSAPLHPGAERYYVEQGWR